MRLIVLAHDHFTPSTGKTGHAVIRYAREGWSGDEVVAVVDRAQAGGDAGNVMGERARGIPIVGSVQDALKYAPEAVVIGIAPVGGALPADWHADLEAALEAKVDIISGLHSPLAADPDLARRAQRSGARIRDVRHEHPAKRITDGAGLSVDALVVLFVGTDCSSGKMTSAIELTKEARGRGFKAAFVATGQTGIMVGCDAGAPIDALVSDFVAGAVEACVLEAARGAPDIIFVEGQGSLSHPAYGGVSASLLHGAFPDVLVMCDEPRRERLGMPPGCHPFLKNAPARERELNEAMLALTSGARVGATALMTRGLSPAEYRAEAAAAEEELGVPADDVFRGGAGRILDGVLAEATRRDLWTEAGFARGVKPRRVKEGLA